MRAKDHSDEEIFRRDGFRCVYCDFDGSDFLGWTFLVIDHFKPRSLGGGNEPENLRTACVICNQMKGASLYSDLEEARRVLGGYRKGMHEYWQSHVRHLLKDKTDET